LELCEYRGKELLREHGIPVPDGRVVASPEEAQAAAEELGGEVVLKAQVPAGGRGKAGGVRFASSPEEAAEVAEELLGMSLRGYEVERLLVERKLSIKRELYACVTVDREAGKPIVMLSAEGGVEVEEVPEELIARRHVEPLEGFQPYMGRELGVEAGLRGRELREVSEVLHRMYACFRARDAVLVEVNPLAVAEEGIFAADAKLTIDDDAWFRQGMERDEEGQRYVELEGSIGCIVNGAGLAMATMDTLKRLGGEPANFLDIGGGAGAEAMRRAVAKVVGNPRVKVLLVNILGGITRCDEIAEGIVEAVEGVEVPVVVRLMGTNEEEGRRILRSAGIEVESQMLAAAEAAVRLSKSI